MRGVAGKVTGTGRGARLHRRADGGAAAERYINAERSARSAKSGGLGHWSAPAPAGRPALDRQVKLLPISSGRGELPEVATPAVSPRRPALHVTTAGLRVASNCGPLRKGWKPIP